MGDPLKDSVVGLVGGSGFLGSFIVSYLAAHHSLASIRVIDIQDHAAMGSIAGDPPAPSSPPGHTPPPITFRKTDVREEADVLEALEGVDFVVHCASAIDFGNSPPATLYNVNVLGTRNVLLAAQRVGARGIVYTSTLDVCVRQGSNLNDAEDDAPYVFTNTQPVVDALRGGQLEAAWEAFGRITTLPGKAGPAYRGPYAASKTVAEQLMLQGSTAGCPVVALRPMGLYGPRDSTHLPAALSAARDWGSRFFPGNPKHLFTHCYVENTAEAHRCAVATLASGGSSGVGGQALFVTDDNEPSNFGVFMQPFVAAQGYVVADVFVPGGVAWTVAFILQALRWLLLKCTCGLLAPRLLLTTEAVSALTTTQTFDGSKARRLLQYHPVVDAEESRRRSISFFAKDPRFPHGGRRYVHVEGKWVCVKSPSRTWVFTALALLVAIYASAFVTEPTRIARATGVVTQTHPLNTVCKVLLDTSSWETWNSFTPSVRTSSKQLGPGVSATLDVNLPMPFGLGLRRLNGLDFTVSHASADATSCKVCWSYNMVPLSWQRFTLATRRCFEAKPEAPGGGVKVSHWDVTVGPLAPLVALFDIEAGFNTMNADLAAHLATATHAQ